MALISLVLLQIITGWQNETTFEVQVGGTLNEIFDSITRYQEVHTLAIFGYKWDVSAYVHVAAAVPKVVITSDFPIFEFSEGVGFNNQMMFLIVGSLRTSGRGHQLYRAFKNVQGYTRGIFIIPKTEPSPLSTLKEFVSWCWRKGFSNSIVLIESKLESKYMQAFRYAPYPELSVKQLNITNETCYFPSKLNNLHGAQIRTSVQFDPPRVFLQSSNIDQLYGYAVNILLNFLWSRNATLKPIFNNNSFTLNMEEVVNDLNNGAIEMSVNPYAPILGIHITYPITMLKWCLIVPAAAKVPPYVYFSKPYHFDTWLLILVIIVALSLLAALCHFITFLGTRPLDMFRSMLFVVGIIVSQPRPLPQHSALIILLIISFGSLITNFYTAGMSSLLTTKLYNPQLDTVKDIVNANLSVHVHTYEKDLIFQNSGLPTGFAELLVSRSSTDIISDIMKLRPGCAYGAFEDLLHFSLSQLMYLKHPHFHFVKNCLTTLPVGFVLPIHSQFELALNMYIMRCASSGILNKWIEDAHRDGRRLGIVHIRRDLTTHPVAYTVTDLLMAWEILFIGLLSATVIFLLEGMRAFLKHLRFKIVYL